MSSQKTNHCRPLADLIRPQKLTDFVGQKHLVGPKGLIRKLLAAQSSSFPSLVFWGPPGCGKTTLARLIARYLKVDFQEFSAVSAKKAELQKIFQTQTQHSLFTSSRPPLVFIDEIHRFSKAQQDVLLSPVEEGKIILITATTENPSFTIIAPLLSRCQTLIFYPLAAQEIKIIVHRGSKQLKRKITPGAEKLIIQISNGDARIALNLVEQAAQITPPTKLITTSLIETIASTTTLRYDKTGEEHYNTISAFIKSMRGSDPNAALYYLARMIKAGEDPLFIARRMVIFASEDIGLADPQALPLAVATFQACQLIGLPECEINLAHCAVYLSCGKKSNASYAAYLAAKKDVETFGNLPIPLKLRNPVTGLLKKVGYGRGYKYPHHHRPEELKNEVYLPQKLRGRIYLKPSSSPVNS